MPKAPKERKRRAFGSGGVFQSKTESRPGHEVWYARISMGTRDGKRIQHKARAGSEGGALRALEDLRRQYGRSGEVASLSLDAYLADWLTDYKPNVRASTYRSYSGHVEHHISPLLGGIAVGKLEKSDVRRLIRHSLDAGKAPATVARIIATLRIALNQARDEGALPDNVANGIRLPKVEREPIRALTIVDAVAVMDAVKKHPLAPLFVLLLGSGMRLGEALGLDRRDVHLDEAYVTVRRSKTKVRAVPISDEAVEALRAHLDASTIVDLEEPVFHGLRGPAKFARLGPSAPSHALPRILEAAGLRTMRVHDLRHGAATLMVLDGAPMRVIAEQLGHSDTRMTDRYAHVVPQSQRTAVRALNVRRGKPVEQPATPVESQNESQPA